MTDPEKAAKVAAAAKKLAKDERVIALTPGMKDRDRAALMLIGAAAGWNLYREALLHELESKRR